MSYSFRLRAATPEDLRGMLAVEQSAFPRERWATRESLGRRLELFPGGSVLAEVGAEIVAFSNGFPIRDLKTQAELDPGDEHLSSGLTYQRVLDFT